MVAWVAHPAPNPRLALRKHSSVGCTSRAVDQPSHGTSTAPRSRAIAVVNAPQHTRQISPMSAAVPIGPTKCSQVDGQTRNQGWAVHHSGSKWAKYIYKFHLYLLLTRAHPYTLTGCHLEVCFQDSTLDCASIRSFSSFCGKRLIFEQNVQWFTSVCLWGHCTANLISTAFSYS